MDITELKRQQNKLRQQTLEHLQSMDDTIIEGERVITISNNPKPLLDNIDQEFEKLTGLSSTDIPFLLLSITLQSMRWVLLSELKLPQMEELSPQIDKKERMKANERCQKEGKNKDKSSGAFHEQDKLSEYREKHAEKTKQSKASFYNKENQYRSWIEILTQPVPYDAMNLLESDKGRIPNIANLNKLNKNGTYNNIYAKNHHVATLGHDPVLGWIFGTINILTSTISFVDYQHYQVIRGHRIKSLNEFNMSNELLFSDQAIDYSSPRTFLDIVSECYYSAREDYKRIAAAVVRQAIHFESDKYCVEGLPIPLMPIIDPQKAQQLIEEGWNSVEFENLLKDDLKQVGISAGFDILVRLILEALYVLCMKSEDDVSIKRVKAQRILSISGSIVSSSNIVYSMVTEKVEKIDIGGIGIEMLHLLFLPNFERKVKQEYIRLRFRNTIMND